MSDYGDELEWDQEAETQMLELEARTIEPRVTAAGQAGIDIELENDDGVRRGPADHQSPDTQNLCAIEVAEAEIAGGGLSVSDLVSASWCEQQTIYRLQAKSHLKPDERPSEIMTASGTSISVDKKRTAAREIILDKGKAVHRDLETQAMGEAVVSVTVKGKEDWWALRVMNTIVALGTLLETGLAREIPVVGFVDEFLVLGIVDEVVRKPKTRPPPQPETKPSPLKKKGPAQDMSQQKLDSFFSVSPGRPDGSWKDDTDKSKATDQRAPRDWSFFLVDSKTRYNRSLPPEAETKPSRLQLMLYHRLLSAMLDARSKETFDWKRLALMHDLHFDAELSESFRQSIAPLVAHSVLSSTLNRATTLQHFVHALKQFGMLLGSGDESTPIFEPVLAIQYRLRQDSRKWKPRKKSRQQREEEDLQRAIAESLRASRRGYTPDQDEEAELLALSYAEQAEGNIVFDDVERELVRMAKLDDAVNPVVDDTQQDELLAGIEDFALAPVLDNPTQIPKSDLARRSEAQRPEVQTLRYDLRPRLERRSSTNHNSSKRERARSISPIDLTAEDRFGSQPKSRSSSPEVIQSAGTVIGTVKFRTSPEELDEWLEDVVRLWKSERPPRGVTLEQTKRCR
ncbi:hypothetical protein OIV83_006466 [Microbotryomycetes sp. JL201]|nr:hypothetical protein OIV83_006466 [Microbotryomycetes sp. JL201]